MNIVFHGRGVRGNPQVGAARAAIERALVPSRAKTGKRGVPKESMDYLTTIIDRNKRLQL